MLHYIAIARSAGVPLSMDDFQRISDRVSRVPGPMTQLLSVVNGCMRLWELRKTAALGLPPCLRFGRLVPMLSAKVTGPMSNECLP